MNTPQVTLTIPDARQIVGQRLGFGATFGGDIASYSSLSPENQVKLNAGVMRFIRENPSLFSADQVTYANRKEFPDGLLDTRFDWDMFKEEFVGNAREINPLDPSNIKTVGYNILIGALALGALYIYIKDKK